MYIPISFVCLISNEIPNKDPKVANVKFFELFTIANVAMNNEIIKIPYAGPSVKNIQNLKIQRKSKLNIKDTKIRE